MLDKSSDRSNPKKKKKLPWSIKNLKLRNNIKQEDNNAGYNHSHDSWKGYLVCKDGMRIYINWDMAYK